MNELRKRPFCWKYNDVVSWRRRLSPCGNAVPEFADYPDEAGVGNPSQRKPSRTGASSIILSIGKSIDMFGISPLGWLHTLGSLPAIPAAAYMLARQGRIVPRSIAGVVYFAAMVIGSGTVFLVAHQPVSYAIGVITLALLFAGYGVGQLRWLGRAGLYIETVCLSLTAFLLMVPTVSETLRRVPDGHPLVTDLNSPILVGAQAILLLALVIGLTVQIFSLRRHSAFVRP
jgi:hypothetical protein